MLFIILIYLINLFLCVEMILFFIMVIILVRFHIMVNHASWCTDIDPALVCCGPVVWIRERVHNYIEEPVKCFLW